MHVESSDESTSRDPFDMLLFLNSKLPSRYLMQGRGSDLRCRGLPTESRTSCCDDFSFHIWHHQLHPMHLQAQIICKPPALIEAWRSIAELVRIFRRRVVLLCALPQTTDCAKALSSSNCQVKYNPDSSKRDPLRPFRLLVGNFPFSSNQEKRCSLEPSVELLTRAWRL